MLKIRHLHLHIASNLLNTESGIARAYCSETNTIASSLLQVQQPDFQQAVNTRGSFSDTIRRGRQDVRPVRWHEESIVPGSSALCGLPCGCMHHYFRANRGRENSKKILRRRSVVVADRLFVRLVFRRQIGHNHAQGVKPVASIQVALQGEIQRIVFVATFYYVVKLVADFDTLLHRVSFFPVAGVWQRRMHFDGYLIRLILHFWQRRL